MQSERVGPIPVTANKVPEGSLLVKCTHCNISVVSTKGTSRDEKLDSLMLNVMAHVKRDHSQEFGASQAIGQMLAGYLAFLLFMDQIDYGKGKQAGITEELIEEKSTEACKAFDDFFDPPADEDEEDEDEPEGPIGEGVIDIPDEEETDEETHED